MVSSVGSGSLTVEVVMAVSVAVLELVVVEYW